MCKKVFSFSGKDSCKGSCKHLILGRVRCSDEFFIKRLISKKKKKKKKENKKRKKKRNKGLNPVIS